jgi:hypothetical protein
VRLPEKCFEWLAGAWKLGVILCPGIWRISIWWDSQPYSLTITLPLMQSGSNTMVALPGRGSGRSCVWSLASRKSEPTSR